jgi:Cu(I)/Ag(I) efflux system membrane fusion protein
MNSMQPGRALALALFTLLLAACARETPAPSEPTRSAADDTPAEHARKHTDPKYRCPMHPDVVRDQPGQCPVCGMDLVKVEETPPAAAGEDSAGEVRISPVVVNNLGVRTEAAVRGALGRHAEVVGYVQFDERRVQQVRPRAEGWVEGLAVRAMGETVQKGQLLFTLYSPMLEAVQQEYLDAVQIGNADLIDASKQRLRALGLDPSAAARAAHSGRSASRVPFYAPVSGVVTELEAREGTMLSPEMVAMTITGTGSLWVIAEVPEAQAGWLATGTSAEVRFPSLPGQPVEGRVDYLYPELSMETRTLRARITLDAPPPGVRANMLANVMLHGEAGEPALNIPRSALIRGGAHDRVVVALGEGRYATRRVVAGAESGDRVAIREGLQEGEQVVVAAQFLLDSEANLDAGLERLDGGAAAPAGAPEPHAGH